MKWFLSNLKRIGLIFLLGATGLGLIARDEGFFVFLALVVLPVSLGVSIWRWRYKLPAHQPLLLGWFCFVSVGMLIIWSKSIALSQIPADRVTTTPSQERPWSTEILIFMDVVPQTEVAGLPNKAQVGRCWSDWCQVAGWEFKSNPRPNKTGLSQLMEVTDARVVWPDGHEVTLEKDVNLGAVSPALPALLTMRFVRYGTYQGELPIGDYTFRFTLADGTVTELKAPYTGEVMDIPHDINLV